MHAIDETLELHAAPSEVAALYADESFAQTRAASFRADSATSRVTGTPRDGFRAETTANVSLKSLPEALVKLRISGLVVEETQVWDVPRGDGYEGQTTIRAKDFPGHFEGRFTLSPTDEGSRMHITGQFSANVPFVGRSIEKAAAPYFSQILASEADTIHRALRERGVGGRDLTD